MARMRAMDFPPHLPRVTASSKVIVPAGSEKEDGCLMYRGTYSKVLLL
jgi:hypothetical protein